MTDQPALIPDIPWNEVHVTVEFIADAYGVTPRAVQLWETERQWIRRAPRGTFPFLGVIRGVYDGQREAINKKKPEAPIGADGKTLESQEEAERREAIADANMKELKEAEMRRDLLPRSEVENAAFDKARKIRDAFENLPSRIGSILAAETDSTQVKALLNREINNILQELSISPAIISGDNGRGQ